VNIKTVNNSL